MSIRPRCSARFREKEQGGIVLQKKHIVIGIIAAVVIIVTAVLAGMKLSRSQQQDTFTPDLEQGTGAWSGDQLPDKSADSGEAVGIKIPGYPSISLPANQQTVQVALLNPEGNPCYFTFELVLSDTNEVLYTSKQVPPGQMIEEITLTRPPGGRAVQRHPAHHHRQPAGRQRHERCQRRNHTGAKAAK